ncbi:MAG: phosphopantetheine-binding protein [Jatrophihabitantaceae bacterium]
MSPDEDQLRGEVGRIWREVLGATQVENDDDFFDSGGDSLAAAKMTSLARRTGLPLRASEVMRYPRFADLVHVLREKATQASADG